MYDKLVTKLNAIDTCGFVSKAQYNTDRSGLEKKIDPADQKTTDTSGLIAKEIITQKLLK